MWPICSHVMLFFTLADINKEIMFQNATDPFQQMYINIIFFEDTVYILSRT